MQAQQVAWAHGTVGWKVGAGGGEGAGGWGDLVPAGSPGGMALKRMDSRVEVWRGGGQGGAGAGGWGGSGPCRLTWGHGPEAHGVMGGWRVLCCLSSSSLNHVVEVLALLLLVPLFLLHH